MGPFSNLCASLTRLLRRTLSFFVFVHFRFCLRVAPSRRTPSMQSFTAQPSLLSPSTPSSSLSLSNPLAQGYVLNSGLGSTSSSTGTSSVWQQSPAPPQFSLGPGYSELAGGQSLAPSPAPSPSAAASAMSILSGPRLSANPTNQGCAFILFYYYKINYFLHFDVLTNPI